MLSVLTAYGYLPRWFEVTLQGFAPWSEDRRGCASVLRESGTMAIKVVSMDFQLPASDRCSNEDRSEVLCREYGESFYYLKLDTPSHSDASGNSRCLMCTATRAPRGEGRHTSINKAYLN